MINFCTNCGTKIRKEDNFCTNCGTKIIRENNFCIYCGAKLKKEDNFCNYCGAKIDKSDIKPNKPLLKSVNDHLEKEKIVKEKTEQNKKSSIKKEMPSKKIEKTEITHGNYCSLNCRHCYEEFFDGGGGIVGDFDGEGYVEYSCLLGHPLSFGKFCKDYE